MRGKYFLFIIFYHCIIEVSLFVIPCCNLVKATAREAFNFPIAIQPDNGPEFANKNAIAYLGEHNVEWRHGPSHTPDAQGLVERLVKTLKEEWLIWKEPTDAIELQSCLEEFKTWYNEMRFHSAIDYQVPQEVYYAST